MIELEEQAFLSNSSLLDGLCFGAEIVGAVISGHTRGRVFRASADSTISFVYNIGFCVLNGYPANAAFASACLDWMFRHADQDFFVLYPGHDGWISVLDSVVTSSVRKVDRIDYEFSPIAFASHCRPSAVLVDFRLMRMDAVLMREIADTIYPWIRKTWKSENHFEQGGIGYCALAQGRVASLCYSVFASESHREIDILTLQPYMMHGLARVVASAYIRECVERDLKPGWSCFKGNLASNQLAGALGFSPKRQFPVYSWHRAE